MGNREYREKHRPEENSQGLSYARVVNENFFLKRLKNLKNNPRRAFKLDKTINRAY